MTVVNLGNNVFTGLSTDTKPTTGVANGSRFIETDTPNMFTWTGNQWFSESFLPSAGRVWGTRMFPNNQGVAGGNGLLFNSTAANGTGVVQQLTIDTTDGGAIGWFTGTNNTKARGGYWGVSPGPGPLVMRKFNPTFTVRFRLTVAQASSQGELYIGFINKTAQPAAGTALDTLTTGGTYMLDGNIGVLFGFRPIDTTFMIMSNNAQASATYTVAGTPNSSATDTNTHTLSISLRDSTPATEILWSFDGVQMPAITDTTNSVPPTGTGLNPIMMIEAQTATQLCIKEHWSQLSMDWL